MTHLYSINGHYDGRLVKTQLVIPPDARQVGVTGITYARSYLMKEDEMYHVEGLDIIAHYASLMIVTLKDEYMGAWGGPDPLF